MDFSSSIFIIACLTSLPPSPTSPTELPKLSALDLGLEFTDDDFRGSSAPSSSTDLKLRRRCLYGIDEFLQLCDEDLGLAGSTPCLAPSMTDAETTSSQKTSSIIAGMDSKGRTHYPRTSVTIIIDEDSPCECEECFTMSDYGRFVADAAAAKGKRHAERARRRKLRYEAVRAEVLRTMKVFRCLRVRV